MRKLSLICGIAAFTATMITLSAREYPLAFKTLTLDEAMAFPGGYGAYGSLTTRKPASLKREPSAVSKKPLYGEVARTSDLPGTRGSEGFTFRADESAGEGKGYDVLIVDLNQNGDLTDDPVTRLTGTLTTAKSGTRTRELSRFGPIEVPASKRIGPWRPVYFAELNYYRSENSEPARSGTALLMTTYLGQFRLKAGYYLETTVEVGGAAHKIGVVDGNANLRLGDEPRSVTYKSSNEENWYFQPADSFLQDADGSGRFEDRAGDPESSPYGAMLYFGATPCRVTLAADCASLRIEPWTGALAELGVQPVGAQVREVFMAWERKPNDWTLVRAGVAQGRARVPPGKLRLTGCVLACDAKDGQPLVLGASYRKLDKLISAPAGQTTPLTCGAPLEIRLSATKREVSGATAMLSTSDADAATPGTILQIRAEIVGAAGETYSTFAKGKDSSGEPAKPKFAIVAKDGKTIASGNLEFG